LRCLKDSILWMNLPMVGLRAECEKRRISTLGVRRSATVEEQQETLYDLLQFSNCEHVFTANGIPARELQTFYACSTVAAQWAEIDGLSDPACRMRYQGMGLSAAQLRPSEIKERLKRVAYWTEVPLLELQRVCRDNRVNSIATESDRERLVVDLVRSVWAPKQSTEPKFGATPKARGPQPPPRPRYAHQPKGGMFWGTEPPPKSEPAKPRHDSMAAHFHTLGLLPSATFADVKKAYRRLALKNHPDKNPGANKERVAQKFHAIVAAYEALTAHLQIK